MASTAHRQRRYADYTVACICPMGVELAPVEGMLDEIHDPLPISRDQNAYTLGEIGGHNIVIAVMPDIGNNAAASVTTQLLNDFPSIRFGLLVGIGGGVPGEEDIRLGDVVVSRPMRTYGGVVQFDLGKRLANGAFERTGQLDRSPTYLSASVRKLEAQHRRLGSQMSDYLHRMMQQYPHMREQYSYPVLAPDRLFPSNYVHQSSSGSTCNLCEQSRVIPRPVRLDNKPLIHYGSIGSANVVVKDAATRDALKRDYGILCIEMEAAGIMNAFPCLVIRGICDYADSHKNKSWQPYAAASAAAYMKELLLTVPSQTVAEMEHAADIMKQIDKDIQSLLTWIDPPGWAEYFEQVLVKRADGTCEWILEHPKFQAWQQGSCSSSSVPSKNVLFIQAKPGFGKTILSATIIEHLARHFQGGSLSIENRPGSIMYYFFDKRRGHSNNVMDAVRAMLAQLINQHKNVDDFRNLAIRIQGKSKDAQSQATSREIEDMLEELFRYLGPTFAVVDGVDECADYDNNFGRLSMIVSNDSNRLLLTGRPSVNLSSNIKWAAQVLHLGSENEADIKDFLLRELKKLMEAGLLHMDSTLDHMATLVSARANGMFLWVRLLIEYLNLPIWTIRERQDALFNLYRLEGLDALYTAILTSLHTLFPRKSHATLTRLFHLVVGARRPLTSRELSIAISVPLDRPHSPLDEIPNFTSSIGRLSGSLVEVTIQGTVQFVHLSLREFLTGALNSPDCDGVPGHIIASYCKEPDLTIASVCLSYLRHTLPARPLEGSSQITPAAFTVNNRHPFLSYSSIFWSDHLVVSLTMIKPRLAPFDKSVWELVSDLLLRFLDDKNRVTAWVEAAWLFATPHIKPWPVKTQLNLDPRLSAIPSLVAGVEKLYRLSEELLDLDQSWSHILMLEPNEIWEPSISTFKKSEFWVTTDQAKLVRLAPLVDNSSPSITVYSQIADSGTELGVIRLFPPCEWTGKAVDCTDPILHLDWKARYELWHAPSNTKIISVEIRLPFSKMSSMLTVTSTLRIPNDEYSGPSGSQETRQTNPTDSVSLPVAISNNARRAVILDSVIHIHLPQSRTGSPSGTFSALFQWQEVDIKNVGNFIPFRSDVSPHKKYGQLFYLKFSPSAQFLVLIRESIKTAMKDTFTYSQLWQLQIFVDKNFNTSSQPNYTSLCFTTFFAVPEISILSPYRGVAFHPTLPRLAFPQVLDGLPQTYIWDFMDPVMTPFPISDPPIVDPYFADEGDYLYGTDAPLEFGFSSEISDDFCTPIVVKVPHDGIATPSTPTRLPRSGLQHSPVQMTTISRVDMLKLAHRPKEPVQHANRFTFEKGTGGSVYISQLHKLTEKGAVVLRTLGKDRVPRAFTISRLPKELRDCVDTAILRGPVEEGGEAASRSVVRLVLNRAHQRYYTAEALEETVLPALVERDEESIPAVISTIPVGRRLEFPTNGIPLVLDDIFKMSLQNLMTRSE